MRRPCLFHSYSSNLFVLSCSPTRPAASVSSRVEREEEGPWHPWCYWKLGLVPSVTLSSVALLRESSSWMLLNAPLQEEISLGHRRVGGKSCLDGPTSLSRRRESLPPIVLGFGASAETRKCPVYNSATHSLSLFFGTLWSPSLISFTLHLHLWQPLIYSLYLWDCFIVFVFFRLHI